MKRDDRKNRQAKKFHFIERRKYYVEKNIKERNSFSTKSCYEKSNNTFVNGRILFGNTEAI